MDLSLKEHMRMEKVKKEHLPGQLETYISEPLEIIRYGMVL